jgi:hypothetical protein
MEINLKIVSSDGDFYNVICGNKEGIISIKCDCMAGIYTKLCKHKLSIATGHVESLYDNNQIEDFKTVQKWINNSGYPELLNRLEIAEKELLVKKKELKKIKDAMEVAMRKGL